jgi:homoserine O-acetyltransferase/O-succinyltransferase
MDIADSTWVKGGAPYDRSRSVGVVRTNTIKLDFGASGFATESGEFLPELEIAYETYGTLSPDGRNAILVTTPLTANCHVAGFHESFDNRGSRGWWDDMVGPGKTVDTTRWFVVCASMLGGCSGTTGPMSINPSTGSAWGYDFPDITIGDMVEVQKLLLDHLGVRSLYAVVGGSMGGMQALEWSLRFPGMVQSCVCVAAAPSLSAQALAFDILGRNAILNDKGWEQGQYAPGAGPAEGLSLARKIAHITYLSAEGMAGKFGRRQRANDATERFHTAFEVEKYLEHQGTKFVQRFDANAYLFITQAMDGFDLARSYGATPDPATAELEALSDDAARTAALENAAKARLQEAFARSRCRYLVVALSSDWLFPASESWQVAEVLLQLGKPVSFCELSSPHGHDGFLLEADQLDQVLTSFLSHEIQPSTAGRDSGVRSLFETDADKATIAAMVRAGSRVLDIGCGDGQLLGHLVRERGCTGEGLDIDLQAVIGTLGRGLSVLQGDAVLALSRFPDGAWDHVVLNQTLQAVRHPPDVLREILRVGREAIVSFPNFAVWNCRLAVLLSGRMPKTRDLPFEWYETPNLHPFTLADFRDYCDRNGIEILEMRERTDSVIGAILLKLGLRNLGADRAIVRIARKDRP